VQGALPGTITVAPAVGVDANATPGSAGRAVGVVPAVDGDDRRSDRRVRLDDPEAVGPEVVTTIWPTTELTGRLTGTVIVVAEVAEAVPAHAPPIVTPAPPWLKPRTPAEAMSSPTFVRRLTGTPASISLQDCDGPLQRVAPRSQDRLVVD
jgi:hypothetical protein